MTNDHNFCIRAIVQWTGNCPVCRSEFTTGELAVYDGNDLPLCAVCAWDKAPALANLLSLDDSFRRYYDGAPPADVFDALKQRQSDPKRLQYELEKARNVLDHCEGSILSQLVTHEIEAALKGDDIVIMRNALRAYQEMGPLNEIPF